MEGYLNLINQLHIEDVKFLQQNISALQEHLLKKEINSNSNDNQEETYIKLLICLLTNIEDEESNNKTNFINLKETSSITNVLKELTYYGIKRILFEENKSLNNKQFDIKHQYNEEILNSTINCIHNFLELKVIGNQNLIEDEMIFYTAAIFCSNKYFENQKCLKVILSKVQLFKYLLILKGTIKSSKVQIQVHNKLLEELYKTEGFSSLAVNICGSCDEKSSSWKQGSVVANIIGKTIKKENSKFMIDEIFKFIEILAVEKDTRTHILTACTLTLNTIYDKFPEDLKMKFQKYFYKFTNISDVFHGQIILEHKELDSFLNILWTCFVDSSSNNELMPTIILFPYTMVLLGLYNRAFETFSKKDRIKLILLRILNNRTMDELKDVVENSLKSNSKYIKLHNRINFKTNKIDGTTTLQTLNSEECIFENELPEALLDILKSSSNNMLMHNFFNICLKLFIENNDSDCRYKLNLINFLVEFVSNKSYCNYLSAHPDELLIFLEHLIEKVLKQEGDVQNLHLILTVVNELYGVHVFTDKSKRLLEQLNNLQKSTICEEFPGLRKQCNNILSKFEHKHFFQSSDKFSKIRLLIDEEEPYLKVYGLSQLIELIDSKDIDALSNKQAIIGIAVNSLRNEESYVYLKAVQVIVSFLRIDPSLIYTLCEEFLNNNENLNYRLKIGEVIIKVLESSKINTNQFKDNLINCFLKGCKDKQEEIVCSSYTNMAIICKFYSYNIHNFFYEIITMIETTHEANGFLLAKRSSIFLLKELIEGIRGSLDSYEDYLPDVYRILNKVSQTTNDPVTRTHANNGLKILSEKCISFLFPEEKLIKSIKIV